VVEELRKSGFRIIRDNIIRAFLDAIQEVLEKIGIEGKIYETDYDARLVVYGEDAIKLLRFAMSYLRHLIKRLRTKLILMLYDGRID
jgi:hypothetical protein